MLKIRNETIFLSFFFTHLMIVNVWIEVEPCCSMKEKERGEGCR